MVLSLTFLILKNLHFIYFKLPYASVVFILQPEIQSAIKKQLERTMWNNEFLQSHEFVQSHEFLQSQEILAEQQMLENSKLLQSHDFL